MAFALAGLAGFGVVVVAQELAAPEDELGDVPGVDAAPGGAADGAVAGIVAAEADGVITHDLLYQAALAEAREMGMVVRDEGM